MRKLTMLWTAIILLFTLQQGSTDLNVVTNDAGICPDPNTVIYAIYGILNGKFIPVVPALSGRQKYNVGDQFQLQCNFDGKPPRFDPSCDNDGKLIQCQSNGTWSPATWKLNPLQEAGCYSAYFPIFPGDRVLPPDEYGDEYSSFQFPSNNNNYCLNMNENARLQVHCATGTYLTIREGSFGDPTLYQFSTEAGELSCHLGIITEYPGKSAGCTSCFLRCEGKKMS